MSKDADKHVTTEPDLPRRNAAKTGQEGPKFSCGGAPVINGRPQYGDVRLAVAASHDDLARRIDSLERSIERGDLLQFAIALATGKLTDAQLAPQLSPLAMREVRTIADEIVKAGNPKSAIPPNPKSTQPLCKLGPGGEYVRWWPPSGRIVDTPEGMLPIVENIDMRFDERVGCIVQIVMWIALLAVTVWTIFWLI